MGGIVKNLDKAMKQMNLEQVKNFRDFITFQFR